MIYGIIGVLLIGGLAFYLTSCNNKSKESGQEHSQQISDTAKVKETKVKENPYPALRTQSFSITPEQLQLKLDDTKTIAYGLIMEWDITDAVISVVTFQTGDASMYISTGQIFIGGISHENIKNSALTFINSGQEYLTLAKPTTETSLPDKGCVRFYFLTNKGKFYIQDTVENIENSKSSLTKLFELGNNVITEYRKTTDQ